MTKTSRRGLDLIKHFEGCRLTAYLCPAGVPTIGYGHTKGVKLGQHCSEAQADLWLEQEYDEYERDVLRLVTVPLTENQKGALVSFAYNLGVGNLKKSTLLRLLNKGDYEGAADQFKRWNKAGGKVLAGLVRRREAEAKLFRRADG